MNKHLITFGSSTTFGCILHLLFPGLGYWFWRDYLFGIFVFLVTIITSGLILVSFIVPLSFIAKMFLFGLPLLFYVVSFIDLGRTIRGKRGNLPRTGSVVAIFLVLGLSFQLLVPLAPTNFLLRNRPELFRTSNNNYAPLVSRGDLVSASRLAYGADLGLGSLLPVGTILHTKPSRCDLVRYYAANGEKKVGVIIGLPAEEIALSGGKLMVNGLPLASCGSIRMRGDWPLTEVADNSILVASLQLGLVKEVYSIELDMVIGKVERLF